MLNFFNAIHHHFLCSNRIKTDFVNKNYYFASWSAGRINSVVQVLISEKIG